MFRFLFFAAVLPLSSFAGAHKEEEICPNGKQHCRTTIRHIESGGIGYEDGYTTLEAFLSPDPSQWRVTPFLDARGHVFDNGRWAVNAGIGLRALWGNRTYGINTYYDYRNTRHLNANQIGVGLETLGELFDVRINGYLPVGRTISAPYSSTFAAFSGHHMLISQKFQSAMKGADAEVGFHFGESKWCDFYAAAGPYYFIGEKTPATWGGKGRISATFKDILTLELSDSYDGTFHNKFQGQISLNFSFGPKSKVKEQGRTCIVASALNNRMLQPVGRQEIIVIDTPKKNAVAINPATGQPYFFVFVNNTSSSNGTYESPYPTLIQAQDNSSPNDVIYVFPGDGTTRGMNSGIFLKANQRFWGSGVNHPLPTTIGTISIPAQSSSAPTITNTNIDTEGNAVTLATNNNISGFTIASAMNDAIFGNHPQSLEVSSCTFANTTTFAIEALFLGDASISLTNNQFLNNVNGVLLTLNGASTVVCSNNTFNGQTSVSSAPFEVAIESNTNTILVENNVFNGNTSGSIRLGLGNPARVDISVLNNVMTNNGTGSQASLGSSLVVISTGTTANGSIVLEGNTFSNNTSNSLYMHTSGAFTNLAVTASSNTMSNNGGSAMALATPTGTLTLLVQNNTLTALSDNGISLPHPGTPTTILTGNITINNNTITNIGNNSNGIAIARDFSTLNLTISNNTISDCAGSGVLCYGASPEFTNMSANITGNAISNCQNVGMGNAASGISLDTHVNLISTVANNTFSNNVAPSVTVGTLTGGDPAVCLTLTGNSSNTDPSYSLSNPGAEVFNLSPCNVDAVNTGTIETAGTITPVQSCPDATPCPP